MSREKLEYNNTVDDDLLDKESSAKYKTSNRGLNNVNNKQNSDDCNVNYYLFCDESGDLIYVD